MNISDSKLLIKVKIAADLRVAFTVPTLCYCCCSQHFTLSMYKSVVEIERRGGERERESDDDGSQIIIYIT